MNIVGEENYTVNYEYDANNRLIKDTKTEGEKETVSNYTYDANGNQLGIMKEGFAPLGYSAILGNENEYKAKLSLGAEIYEYDALNRLTSSFNEGIEVTYTYKANGMRHSKTSGESATMHIWDGSNIAADITGESTTSYTRGVNLICSSGEGGQKYYLYNGHGDVVQLTDATGEILWRYEYDAFGNEKAIDGQDAALDTNPFRYCGEYWDDETSTYYLRARYYDPAIGRFLTEDTLRSVSRKMPNGQEIADPLSLNLYTYCTNNPVMYVDPSGHTIKLVGDSKERGEILKYLRELTDHKLSMKYEKGIWVVYIKSYADKGDVKYASGNELIIRMINHEKATKIMIGEGNGNYFSGYTIILDPKSADVKFPTINPSTGNVSEEKRPLYISLAHELIHADHEIRGVHMSGTENWKFQSWRLFGIGWLPIYSTHPDTPKEELYTIGLKYANTGDITENMIRAEHGLNLRGAYFKL